MQKIYIGIDVGSVSVKVVAIKENGGIVHLQQKRTYGRPAETVKELLSGLSSLGLEPAAIIATGSGSNILKYTQINEFKAITTAITKLFPNVSTIFEMGGETSKFIRIENGSIIEYGMNGDCAAGTGSFIDQQAERLHYKVEEVGPLVLKAEKPARIAGRCSVFAKSDMIHAQQKGYSPPEVLKGLCLAVVRNFKATVVRGRHIVPRVAFIGGLALNDGVVSSVNDIFELSEGDLIIPKDAIFIGAIGAAILARDSSIVNRDLQKQTTNHKSRITNYETQATVPVLLTENVRFLRDKVKRYEFPKAGKIDVYLGIDVGSVSTNFVVLDQNGDMVMEIYTYTKARPIEVVKKGLEDIHNEIGEKINVVGVGTTGSGRELIGELVGADIIKDEITAHKMGAVHICKKLTNESVDTIFEIGGQDAKYIRIENGVVTDFAMNEACAAGTGSFLEEQAQRLGIKIKEEFAQLALSSKSPISLGERCTVFMERDVNTYQLNGAKVEDVVAGLAYSVATNYLNRVVRGRKIGDHIFFQGGTAYNDAVAAAFSKILGKTITVPPHNGVIGAVGAALLARDSLLVTRNSKKQITNYESRITKFRGFDITKINYTMREFACNVCTNQCDIQEFNVSGEKTYWGDKCSIKFRKKAHTDNKPAIKDLFKIRKELLQNGGRQTAFRQIKIGIPKTMFYFDRFPFWNAYFKALGFDVVTSDDTNKIITHDSIELSVAEPCYPIKLANGHVNNLILKDVDYVFIPNVISAEKPATQEEKTPIPYLCPWHQTLPYVVRAVPAFSKVKFLISTIQFELGLDFVEKCLGEIAEELNVAKKDNRRAIEAGYAAQGRFNRELQWLGKEALATIKSENGSGIILVGRPYNIYDTATNLNTPTKLREFYGLNVIPIDFLPVDELDIKDVSKNMFWNYGRKIVAAAKIVAENPNLHMIYITNFKCGPDSFIKHFATWSSKSKPYLTLQFDEHANDAGVITRIEAYLDSKGLLKAENSNEKFRQKYKEERRKFISKRQLRQPVSFTVDKELEDLRRE